jgi:SAM-dependent methyltransferase
VVEVSRQSDWRMPCERGHNFCITHQNILLSIIHYEIGKAMPEEANFAHEVGRGLSIDALPDYTPMLEAYHRAHAAELRSMVADLPLCPADQVLDLACGDGIYSCWIAERLGPEGRVVGVDIAPAYLERARRTADGSPAGARVSFCQADAYQLPFDDGQFDLAWCAQSMFSLPDPVGALRELRRVVRPGGLVAVFENDLLHPMILPWSAELELAVRAAHLAEVTETKVSQLAVGRELCPLFSAAGLSDCQLRTYSTVRQAPLSSDEEAYLGWYLGDLRTRARHGLDPAILADFDALTDPASEHYMLRRPDFVVTYIDLVALGVRSQGKGKLKAKS